MSETLRYELAPFGIDSVIVEPGPFETNFNNSTKKAGGDDRAAHYTHIAEANQYRWSRTTPRDPKLVVDAIVQLMDTPRGRRPTRTPVHPLQQELEALNAAQSRTTSAMLDLYGGGPLLENGV
jgi:NAD(P)-dependent dehydrogenase (short-subunit alcohol dehydrogenase family)